MIMKMEDTRNDISRSSIICFKSLTHCQILVFYCACGILHRVRFHPSFHEGDQLRCEDNNIFCQETDNNTKSQLFNLENNFNSKTVLSRCSFAKAFIIE